MAKRFAEFLLLAAFCLVGVGVLVAQVTTVGTLTGAVTDPTRAVVAGADVRVMDEATGAVYETKTGTDGLFTVANLKPGNYTVTVTMQGFKTAQYRALKIVVGGIYDLAVKLEVGAVATTVTVEAGAEVLETASTAVGTTIMGKSITQLPFTSRDLLDLATLMPGAQTTGRPRATSFMGLPKGAINITYDGINAQDNVLKSSDGFFTIIRPRVDAVEEFTITTAAQSAEQATEGAVQIRFETKRGTNDYHGGVWWYHRNDFLNSNYYFSNLDGTPRQRLRLNQFGYKIGGPILKDRLFFFTDFDFFRKPESQIQSRTILTDAATNGLYTYPVSAVPSTRPAWVTCDATAKTCTANVMAMAAANGFTSTIDSQVKSILTAMNSSVSAPGVQLGTPPSLFQRSISFNSAGRGNRYFPDFRFDWNITKNHQFEAVYHYQFFTTTPDFLNGVAETYPVAPFNKNFGSQISNRNLWVGAWRWNIGTNKSNELRFGLQTAQVSFFPDMNLSIYPQASTNLGPIRLRPLMNLVSQPFLGFGSFPRNTPLAQLIENFNWTKGKHTLFFGGTYAESRAYASSSDSATATVNLGIDSSDPADGMFTTGNLAGIDPSTADLDNARDLYGMLAGRITGYSGVVYVDENKRKFITGTTLIQRATARAFSVYGSDQFRVRPSLTINYGLRWQYQAAPFDPKNISFRLKNGVADLYGVSGLGNLFKPGTLTGTKTVFELANRKPWYERDLRDFAPSLGMAWQPGFNNRIWNRIFGGPGKTVFRAGYSITYTREGGNNFASIAHSNPGFSGAQFSSPADPSGPIGPGQFGAGTLALGSLNIPTVDQDPPAFVSSFEMNPFAFQSANSFDPHLRIPMVQTWQVGIQRELTPNMVVEVRYVGNHGTGLWRQVDLNEINIFENGFQPEFLNARSNLAICRANQVACRTAGGSTSATFASFANLGLPGQVAVPILTAAFTGSKTGSQRASSFRSGTFITQLDRGTVGSMGNTLSGGTFNLSFWQNLVAAGFPPNFWRVHPDATGGTFLFYNGTHSSYHGLQVEARRRPAKGLQFSGNYTFSKSLTNYYADSSVSFASFDTLRNSGRNRGPAPWDLRHQFKLQLIYEFPFGPGRRWSSGNPVLNRIIGGWEFNSITRWQSGRIFRVTGGLGGTFDQNDPGVQLIGLSIQQLQKLTSLRKTPTPAPGAVFYFPDTLLDANRQRASTTFLKSCSTPGQFCQRLFLYGPQFFRADWSIVKRTRVTERVNIEYRAEFLNAFNNQNFYVGGTAATTVPSISLQSTTFGRITQAYRDISTTDDPGGRIIQMVLRVNF